jgi:hypothetical protein
MRNEKEIPPLDQKNLRSATRPLDPSLERRKGPTIAPSCITNPTYPPFFRPQFYSLYAHVLYNGG